MKIHFLKWTHVRLLSFLLFLFIGTHSSFGQFKYEWKEYSVAVTDFKFGVPFLQSFTPIHPGLELGANFLVNDKERSAHKVGINVGGFHHRILANGFYINGTYTYEQKIKQTIGLDIIVGVGYLYTFYPGDAYKFNPESQQFETITSHQGFFMPNLETRISYLKTQKIKPFIGYNLTVAGNASIITSILKLGVSVNL